MAPARVLVIDDHQVVRLGVKTLLAGNPEWEIVGEAENGKEGIDQVGKLRPDVVILDISMPVMNGYEALPHIRKIVPLAKIVMFSMHDMPSTANAIGADAFVAKARAAEDLASTLKRVLQIERVPASEH